MSDACVTSKIYLSGEPISFSQYDLYALTHTETGPAVVAVTSWKELPETEVPALAVPTGTGAPSLPDFEPGALRSPDWVYGQTSAGSAKGRYGRNSHRVHPSLEHLPTDERTRAALSQIAYRPPAGHGLLISSPYGAGSRQAARSLAELLAPQDSVFYAAPSADRWTVEEVDDFVARPAYMKSPSGVRPVIVVEDLDLMPPSVADRLLKILEEPPGGALFIFTTSDPARLRPAIRGRMAGHVPIAPAASPERRHHYETLGASTTDSRAIDELVGSNVTLGAAIAKKSKVNPDFLTEVSSALSPGLRSSDSPVTAAVSAAAGIDAVSKPLAEALPLTEEDSLDDAPPTKGPSEKAVKATQRMLARTLVDAVVEDLRRTHLTEPLREGNAIAVDRSAQLITAVRTAARDARAAISAYIPPERALIAFYTRLASLGL